MPMPLSWVDKIFLKLEMSYGHRFLSQWPGASPEAIKADWQHELDGMEKHPDAIAYALSNLPPDNPVNVLQFRELCRRAPEPVYKALPAPEVDREKAQEVVTKVKAAMAPIGDHLSRQREHMRMEMDGLKLDKVQREFWRVALNREILAKTGIDTKKPFSLQELKAALS